MELKQYSPSTLCSWSIEYLWTNITQCNVTQNCYHWQRVDILNTRPLKIWKPHSESGFKTSGQIKVFSLFFFYFFTSLLYTIRLRWCSMPLDL